MRMPDVDLSDSPLGLEYVRFHTRCGRVNGTAFRARGERETHYDVSGVHRVEGITEPHMSPISEAVGKFDVVGPVTQRFEDGVCIVSVHGFEFWIEPDECKKRMNVEDVLAFEIDNLTLYI